MTTRTVLVSLVDDDLAPYANAIVTATLSATDYDAADDITYVPETFTYRTDDNGDVTLNLWPNARGEESTAYRIMALTTGGVVIKDLWAVVPDSDGSLLADISTDVVDPGTPPPAFVDEGVVDDVVATEILAHEAKDNPHPQYATGGSKDTHSSRVDNPHAVTAAQVGAEPAGTAASQVSVHEALPDPHGQYLQNLAPGTANAIPLAADDGESLTRSEAVIDGASRLYGHGELIEDVAGTTYTLTAADRGKVKRFTSDDPVTVTLPEVATEDLSDGFFCDIEQAGNGQVQLVTEGSDTLTAHNGVNYTYDKGSRIRVSKSGDGAYNASGQTGNAFYALPLDAPAGDLTNPAVGFDGKLAASGRDQIGTMTLAGSLAIASSEGMMPSNSLSGTGKKLDVSSGITVVGFTPTLPTTAGATPDYSATLSLADAGTFSIEPQVVLKNNNDGTYTLETPDGGSTYDYDGGQVTLYMNASTGQWGVGFYDGSGARRLFDVGALTATQLVIVMSAKEYAGGDPGNAGAEVIVRLNTSAREILSPVPDGASDGAGVAVTGSAALSAHEAATNPHPQYATGGAQDSHSGRTDNPHGVTAAQVGADPSGTAAGAVSTHEASANPHPQYSTGGAQDTHSGRTDNPHGVTAAQTGADPSGTAASAMTAHEAAGDPHPGYVLESTIDQNGGVAGLSGSGKVDASVLPTQTLVDGGDVAIDDADVVSVPANNQPTIKRLASATAGADKLTLGSGKVVVPGDVIVFPEGGAATSDWELLCEGPPRIIDITASTTITGEHKNALLRVNSASDVTLTLPQSSTEALHTAFGFGVVQVGAGAAIFATEGAETLLIKSGMTKTNGIGAPAQVVRSAAAEWMVAGDLA